ncbi:alpha/beta hydrolase [Vibrio sp. SCSIO 43137]|uniref:alpha/beta hydrolase n=1 Tax=Vibrio sp. SCSIO 43137 TaxID=3021011 RepID=UPI002307E59F|nr:alpha/beta hydrolase [Vibrio sp. SCSIO 43137]WCE31882.1 alpha/beta hydrolase [Vibrio sp. SCSIO 43137]
MKKILLNLLLFYLLFAALLYTFQRQFLYHPRQASSAYGEMNVSFTVDGITLSGWVLNQKQNRALIYYGGNAESIEANIPFFKAVLPDYAVYLIPYRGYSNNSGSPTEKALYRDALQIFDSVNSKHDSVSLVGRSLGSGIATYVAANRQIDKLVLVTPFDSVENVAREVYWMFPVSLLLKDKYNSAGRVNEITAQTYIFTAEKDAVIPKERTDQLIAEFDNQLKESVIISGAGHNNISQFPAYISKLKRALE